MPISPVARLEKLEELLSALPGEPMLASPLDGFVAGLLVCPALVLPSEWLPEVWGADATVDPAPVFETEQQAKDVAGLAVADLASGQVKADRQAVAVGFEVDLAREPAPRASERLIGLPPCAPVAESTRRPCAQTATALPRPIGH